LLKNVKAIMGRIAMETGMLHDPYRRVCRPDGLEYAEYLKRHGNFHSIGEHCFISPRANIADPTLVRLGNNVRISDCSIFGHDGSVNMLNRAYGLKLDNVGPVDIKDNVYLGFGCIIQPGVTIGPNAIVSAGSVVVRDVKEGTIVSGVPAQPVGSVAMSLQILKARNTKFPWRHLIEQRGSDFDPKLEPELARLRSQYFFGD
jgi:acetyltransferase-like isoleucine patch superfamily enzyme